MRYIEYYCIQYKDKIFLVINKNNPISISAIPRFAIKYIGSASALIILINQVNYHFHHYILFFRPALGNHQSKCHKGIVTYQFRAVGLI